MKRRERSATPGHCLVETRRVSGAAGPIICQTNRFSFESPASFLTSSLIF